jgi:MFS transporter, DHA2 family, multidrug resistance protein
MNMTGGQSDPGLPRHLRWRASVAVSLAVSMAAFDLSIVNTALPHIARVFAVDPATSVWVVSSYQLPLVATLLPLAALGEIVGHKKVFLWGLLLFCLASVLCGLAWSLPMLAAMRALQGVGASAMLAVNIALIRFVYPPSEFGRGVGFNAVLVGASFAAGPSLAAAILSVAEWPYLFYVNVPLGLIALGFGARYLPRTRLLPHPFDPWAALLTGLMFVLVVLAIESIGHGGGEWRMAGEAGGAALCLLLLLRRQQGHPAPILALDLYANRIFALSSLVAILAYLIQGVALVALPFLFINGFGMSQVDAGLYVTPWPAVVSLLATSSGRMADRYSVPILNGVGLFALTIGLAMLAFLPVHPDTWRIVGPTVLCGAGFGLFQAPNAKAMMLSVPPARVGGASGIFAVQRNLGQTCGAALGAVCFRLMPASGPRTALAVACALAALAAVASMLRLKPRRPAA